MNCLINTLQPKILSCDFRYSSHGPPELAYSRAKTVRGGERIGDFGDRARGVQRKRENGEKVVEKEGEKKEHTFKTRARDCVSADPYGCSCSDRELQLQPYDESSDLRDGEQIGSRVVIVQIDRRCIGARAIVVEKNRLRARLPPAPPTICHGHNVNSDNDNTWNRNVTFLTLRCWKRPSDVPRSGSEGAAAECVF